MSQVSWANLNGPQASLGGQQDDHPVTEVMAGTASKNDEVVDVAKREYFCLFAWHTALLNRS